MGDSSIPATTQGPNEVGAFRSEEDFLKSDYADYSDHMQAQVYSGHGGSKPSLTSAEGIPGIHHVGLFPVHMVSDPPRQHQGIPSPITDATEFVHQDHTLSLANLQGAAFQKSMELHSFPNFPNLRGKQSGRICTSGKSSLEDDFSQSLKKKRPTCRLQTSLPLPGGEMSTFEPMYDQSHGLQAQLTDCPRYLRTSENQLTIERSESYRMSCDPFRTRWKPNSVQLSILEEHFNSGYTKATPELHAAVQGAGLATESQVSVWLKNRLSRCRRAPMKMDKDAPTSDGEEKEDDKWPWEDFQDVSSCVLSELSMIVEAVHRSDIMLLAESIGNACRICCYGAGREGFVMQGLASSLHHLGHECYVIGDTNLPRFGPGDLFIASAGPSFHNLGNAIAMQAFQMGAKVVALTPLATPQLPFADHVVRIPAPAFPASLKNPSSSIQDGNDSNDIRKECLPLKKKEGMLHFGSAFEMSLWVTLECVSIMLRKLSFVSVSDMRARHTNLE